MFSQLNLLHANKKVKKKSYENNEITLQNSKVGFLHKHCFIKSSNSE